MFQKVIPFILSGTASQPDSTREFSSQLAYRINSFNSVTSAKPYSFSCRTWPFWREDIVAAGYGNKCNPRITQRQAGK